MNRSANQPAVDVWKEWVMPLAVGAGGALVLAVLLWPRRASAASYYAGPVVPEGRVLSPFGPRTKNGITRSHDGIDLQATRGTPIHAAGAGVVMGVWNDNEVAGYGNLVVIKHRDGEGALYAHMDTIDPAMVPGARVTAGQKVGTVGCTDSEGGFPCSGAHLHFEVMVPAVGDDRAFTHFHGGDNRYPERVDPAIWASRLGLRLV